MRKRFLRLIGFSSLVLLPALFLSPSPALAQDEKDWVPGQLLVRVQDGTSAESVQQLAESAGVTQYKKITSWDLYRFDFDPSTPTEPILEKLNQNPLVKYAEPNRRMEIQQTASNREKF